MWGLCGLAGSQGRSYPDARGPTTRLALDEVDEDQLRVGLLASFVVQGETENCYLQRETYRGLASPIPLHDDDPAAAGRVRSTALICANLPEARICKPDEASTTCILA